MPDGAPPIHARWLTTDPGPELVAEIDGHRVRWRSDDVVLHPRTEALGSLMLIPALGAGRPLALDGRVDGRWRRGTGAVAEVAREFWGYPPVSVTARRRLPRRPGRERVLCFTCGVDSMHSLLCADWSPDRLLFIQLETAERAQRVERLVRVIADAAGVRVAVVHTDLMALPSFAAEHWEHTHGAALAAAGHTLAFAGHLGCSGSLPDAIAIPWGTHFKLDRHWSAGHLAVEHLGGETDRLAKTIAIAGHPLAREHLQVCWEHLEDGPNCSRCDKCLLTMAQLEAAGSRDAFATFDREARLPERLDDLSRTVYPRSYGGMLRAGVLSPPVAAAAQRLLDRSPRPAEAT